MSLRDEIKKITKDQANLVIRGDDCSDFETDYKVYYYTYTDENGKTKHIGLDYSCTGEGWVEEFDSEELCFAWLNGEFEMSDLEDIPENEDDEDEQDEETHMYMVDISEIQYGFVEVVAKSKEDAIRKARKLAEDGDIIWTESEITNITATI